MGTAWRTAYLNIAEHLVAGRIGVERRRAAVVNRLQPERVARGRRATWNGRRTRRAETRDERREPEYGRE